MVSVDFCNSANGVKETQVSNGRREITRLNWTTIITQTMWLTRVESRHMQNNTMVFVGRFLDLMSIVGVHVRFFISFFILCFFSINGVEMCESFRCNFKSVYFCEREPNSHNERNYPKFLRAHTKHLTSFHSTLLSTLKLWNEMLLDFEFLFIPSLLFLFHRRLCEITNKNRSWCFGLKGSALLL